MEEEHDKINEWYDQEKENLATEFKTILQTSKDKNADEKKFNKKIRDLHATYEQKMIKLFEKEKVRIQRERKKKRRNGFFSKLTKSIKEKFKKEEEDEK